MLTLTDGEWVSEVVDDRLCVRFNEDLQQYLLNVYPENVEKKEDLPKVCNARMHHTGFWPAIQVSHILRGFLRVSNS